MKKALRVILIVLIIVFVAIQFVPYGRSHGNPPVIAEPMWDSPQTRATFFRACVDCHSNESVWPWYSHIAPASWLVQSDVEEGRRMFNVSEWGHKRNKGDEAAAEVRSGDMPLPIYLPLHPNAKLSLEEQQLFIKGLVATFGEEGK